MLSSPQLTRCGVRHGFFTRLGGVSRGAYSSLNCGLGSGDDPDRVAINRSRAVDRLGLPADRLATLRQVHSGRVVVVDAVWPPAARPEADGLVTREPGTALGILTADCAPVLFADAEAGVVGAAHAGWRGARAGIVERTVAAMEGLGARRARITASIGPCIAQVSYEVDAAFRDGFVAADPGSAALFARGRRDGHLQFDLAGYVARRLEALGIDAFDAIAADTFADGDRFFSYRRTTLAGGGDYGRQLSVVVLATG